MAFSYIQKGATLTSAQEALLDQIENLPSPFGGIKMLKDLRTITNVSVVVSDTADLVSELGKYIVSINEQISKYKKDKNRTKIFNQIEGEIYGRLRWAEEQLMGVKSRNIFLLGLYSRKLLWFNTESPVVYLFADNIRDYAKRTGLNEDNVFAFVFVHEMMHAYYDAFNSDGFPSREPIEEAFAEFGMLTFINDSFGPSTTLFTDAYKCVDLKKKNGPKEYGFGVDLFDISNRSGDNRVEMINRYRDISNWIDSSNMKSLNPNYFIEIDQYKRNSNYILAMYCYDGVKEILEYDWTKPNLIIQRSIKGSRPSSESSSSGPTGSKSGLSRAIPKLSAKAEWALIATKIGCDAQCPLIRKNDFYELLTEILKVMRKKGLESYLSISGDALMFLGKMFSKFTATFGRIPEPLCVGGKTVYLDFGSPVLWSPEQIGNILYALSILFDSTFTIVHENSHYTLYGPAEYQKLFSSIDSTEGSWLVDVQECVESIPSTTFTLGQVYTFENDLQEKHPNNKNVQAKIRQVLQRLVEKGILERLKDGEYRKL